MKAAFSPTQLHLDVAFYDENERDKLLRYPTAVLMESLVRQGAVISVAEFLTYFLFHRKRGNRRYSNYADIANRSELALSMLEDMVDFHNNSICTSANVVETEGKSLQDIMVSEHVGEAVGLALVGRLHGLTEADWEPIRTYGGRNAYKTLDYEIACDGHGIVQVECKGSAVQDNTLSARTISRVQAHYRGIVDKKNSIRSESDYPHPASLRYGTITALDSRRDGHAKCWLVDPPALPLPLNPMLYRLLARLSFLCTWIAFVSPNSALAAALATRIASLIELDDPYRLNGIRLYKGSSKSFGMDFQEAYGRKSAFFNTKSTAFMGRAGGVTLRLSESALFFLGIQDDLLRLVVDQDFDSILKYEAEPKSVTSRVTCVISRGRFQKMKLQPEYMEKFRKLGPYRIRTLEGQLHTSPGGLVFGILPLT